MLFRELTKLLRMFSEPDAIHEARAAFAFHHAFDVVALEAGAEHANDPVDFRIFGDAGALLREYEIVNVLAEILIADVMEVAAFLDDDLRSAAGVNARRAIGARRRTANELLNERGFRARFDDDKRVGETRDILTAERVQNFKWEIDLHIARDV